MICFHGNIPQYLLGRWIQYIFFTTSGCKAGKVQVSHLFAWIGGKFGTNCMFAPQLLLLPNRAIDLVWIC